MEVKNGIATHNFLLRSRDADPHYTGRLETYFDLMQESAAMHAYYLEIGIPHLQEEKRTWVITRTQMTIHKWATWPTTINVETWPQVPFKFYYPRGCRGYNEDGTTLLFESMTLWLIIDKDDYHIIKPDDRYKKLLSEAGRYVDPEMKKRLSFTLEKYKKIEKAPIHVQYQDSDSNFHINNVAYLQWMISSLPFTLLDHFQPSFVDISYLKQAFRDDTIMCYTGYVDDYSTEINEFTLNHHIVKIEEDGKETSLCFANTTWKKRKLF